MKKSLIECSACKNRDYVINIPGINHRCSKCTSSCVKVIIKNVK